MCIRKILCAALCALLLTGCAQARPAFIPHGYLADESVAQVGEALYAFLPKTGEAGPRTYLCELRQGQAEHAGRSLQRLCRGWARAARRWGRALRQRWTPHRAL